MQAGGEDEAVGTLDGLVFGANREQAAGQGVADLAVAAGFVGRAELVEARVAVLIEEVVADAAADIDPAADPDLQPGGQRDHGGMAAGLRAGLDAETQHDAQRGWVREGQAVVELHVKLRVAAGGLSRAAGWNKDAGGDGVRPADDRQGRAGRGVSGGGRSKGGDNARQGQMAGDFHRCSFQRNKSGCSQTP